MKKNTPQLSPKLMKMDQTRKCKRFSYLLLINCEVLETCDYYLLPRTAFKLLYCFERVWAEFRSQVFSKINQYILLS